MENLPTASVVASTEADTVLKHAHPTLQRSRGVLEKRPAADKAQLLQCVEECKALISPIDAANQKLNKELRINHPEQNLDRLHNDVRSSERDFREEMRRLNERGPDDPDFKLGGGGGKSISDAMDRMRAGFSSAQRSYAERNEYLEKGAPEGIALRQYADKLTDCRRQVDKTIHDLNELLEALS